MAFGGFGWLGVALEWRWVLLAVAWAGVAWGGLGAGGGGWLVKESKAMDTICRL